MANHDVLNSLLKEYEQKKIHAELEAERKKENLSKLLPRLREIDEKLNQTAISTAKSILASTHSIDSINELNKKINLLKKERESILLKNHYPIDFLKPDYECKICNDTGYLTNSSFQTVMCNCLKQKLLDDTFNKSNMYHVKQENFSYFNENLFSNEEDLAKYKIPISPRKNILLIKERCIDFVEHFEDPKNKNLLFTGSTGLGKTFMSNCIAAELLNKGKTVLYQTAPVLLESVIDYKMSKNKQEQDNIYQSVLEADLLIIDDLGTESLNSMKLSELFTIINTRILNLNHKITKTIISTNLSIHDIFRNYEERIGSRIAGYYDCYCFFGNDLRFHKK